MILSRRSFTYRSLVPFGESDVLRWGGGRWVAVLLVLLMPVVVGATPASDSLGSDSGLRVSVAGEAQIDATPGSVVTAVFRIHNRRPEQRSVTLRAHLPSDWTLVTSLGAVSLPPNESIVRLVSVAVPKKAAVATHSIRVTAEAPSSRPIEQQVDVQVAPVRELAIQPLDGPSTVPAGEDYTARFALVSKSNVPLRVRLDAESSRQLPMQTASQSTRLAPWDTTPITVTVQTEPVSRAFRHRLTLRARTEDGDHSAEGQSTVEIVPVDGARGSDEDMYPVAVRMQTVGDAAGVGQQVEVQGSGPLTTDGAHAVDLFVRTPSSSGLSGFGRRDRYQLTYESDDLQVQAGDHVYQQTPLTETGRLGLGVGAAYQGEGWTVGGHALRARYGGTARQAAAFVGLQAHSRFGMRGTVIQNGGLYDGTFVSLQGRVEPWSDATLTVEGGAGQGHEGTGTSYRAALDGEHAWGSYHIEHLRADAAVPTSTQDVERTSAHGVVRVSESFVLDGSYRRLERGLSAHSFFSYESSYGKMGVRPSGQWGVVQWTGGLYGVYDQTGDRTTQTLNARANARVGWVGVRSAVEMGRRSFGIKDGAYRAYSGQLSLRTDPVRVSGGADYEIAPTRARTTPAPRLSINTSAQVDLAKRTELSLRAHWSASETPSFDGYRTVSIRLDHHFRFGHRLSVEARSNRFADTPFSIAPWTEVPSYRVSYTVPVGLPVVQERSTGVVTGRVVDAETGAGIADALIRLGDTEQYTDENGRFTLSRSAQYLRLDRASIGLDRVPMMPMPLKIDRDQTSSPIVVPVTNSASLTARIVLYDHPTLRAALTGEDPIAVDSLDRVVVEVEDDQGRRRRLTSADGTARFDDLRPGTWTLRLVDPSLPDDHVLAQETHTIKLTPGATDSVTVKVVPRPQNDPTASQSGKTLGGKAMPQDRTSASSIDSGRTLTAPSSTPDASTDESATGEKHEVKHVEWLAQLSRNYYDTLYCWTVIWEANRDELADPDELRPGMELTIPPAEACTVEKPGPPIPDSLRPSVQRHSLLPPTKTVAPPTGPH